MTNDRQTLTAIYALYALSTLMQMFMETFIAGLIVMIGAVSVSYALRRRLAGSWMGTHCIWLIRTFWIGTGVYMPILTALASAALLSRIDMRNVMDMIAQGQVADPGELGRILMELQGDATRYAVMGATIPFLGWWFWRCWTGWRLLTQDRMVPNVNRWI